MMNATRTGSMDEDITIKLSDGIDQLKSKNYPNAIGIAGLATSGRARGGRYSPEDVIKANAKMYAGVKVMNETPATQATPTTPETPTNWVYMTNDSYTITDETHRTLEAVADIEKPRAQAMYDAIVGLAVGEPTDESNKILGMISKGATVAGTKFQLLFHYNVDIDDKISGEGMIRYNEAPSFKKFVVTENMIISSAIEGKSVLALMNSLLGQDLKLEAPVAPDAKIAAAAAKKDAAGGAGGADSADDLAATTVAPGATSAVVNSAVVNSADADSAGGGDDELNRDSYDAVAEENSIFGAQTGSRGGKSTRRKRKGSRKKGSSKKPVSHKKRKRGASKKKRSHPKKK